MNNKKQGLIYFYLSAICLIAPILFGCNNEKHKEVAHPTSQRVALAFINRDSTLTLDVGLMQIIVAPKYDSITRDYIVVTDTNWGKPEVYAVLDPVTKIQKIDSFRNPVFNVRYNIYPKDSVIWRLELVNYDSLLKKYYYQRRIG